MTDTIEEGVVQAIGSPDLQDSVAELAEIGLDQLLGDGVLREVPILGTLVRAIRLVGTVRDALLAKKLLRFLLALREVPLRDRQAFCESLGDQTERKRVGEALILLLDRLDDMNKSELIGRLYKALIQSRIDQTQFGLLSSAVDRLHLARLPALLAFYGTSDRRDEAVNTDLEAHQEFAFAGLVRVEFGGSNRALFDSSMGGGGGRYVQNELGRRFVEILSRDV